MLLRRAPQTGLQCLARASSLRFVRYGQKASPTVGPEIFGGRDETDQRRRLVDPEKEPHKAWPAPLTWSRWPAAGVADLGPEYFHREGQKHPTRYFQMRTKDQNVCFVGSTDARQTDSRTIRNAYQTATHSIAVQLILEGRGVKAYYQPKYPSLLVRMGVGTKVQDLSYVLLRDKECMVHVNKPGTLLVVEGPTRAQAGRMATTLFHLLRANIYTGKGIHINGHPTPIRKRASRGKK
mmetsp:Transcript_23863/g.54318  ORF Transcript_23863/g.54318 Transcript_23863/m.54318 type:complete len:237 (+) Transcript_23863:43-753(+)